jgi:Ca2+-binding EF-hand superfamily protein
LAGLPADHKKAEAVLTKHDADKSGSLDWSEFLEVMSEQYAWQKADFQKNFIDPAKAKFPQLGKNITAIVEAFREHDADSNGTIDINELQAVLETVGESVAVSKLQQVLTKYDANGNGILEWLEFVSVSFVSVLNSQIFLVVV